MSKKNTSLSTAIRSKSHLTVVQLHTVARDAAAAAAEREAAALAQSLALIEEAELGAAGVLETAQPEPARAEVRAARIALAGACIHLRAAIEALGKIA